jgi:hypothetical protein
MPALIILCLCNWHNSTRITVFPPFAPNDYLYSQHKDKGSEKWQIYAWACRDIMARYAKVPKQDCDGLRAKIEYEKLLGVVKRYD